MLATCLLVVPMSVGCFDMDWDWETGRWYPKEPADGSAKRRVSPASRRAGGKRDVSAGLRSASAPLPSATGSDAPDASRGAAEGYYRLYLLSGPEAESAPIPDESAESSVLHVRVNRASARQVGQLLVDLYPPIGPGGTEHRYYLVYQSPVASRSAAQLAEQMDKNAQGVQTGADIDPPEAFRSAVPLYYELARRRHDPALAEEILARLDLAAGSDKVASQLRWASYMMSARLQADQRADATAQKRALEAARGVVPDDSFEAFLAGAALVRWHAEYGRPDAARDLAKLLVVRFQRFQGTFAYDECLRLARD